MKTKDKIFIKTAMSLAIPIALQNLLISCASLVDTAMITPIGNVALSAVGVGGRFTFMLNIVAFGMCSGSATMISQYWGINDRKHIHNSFGLTVIISMIAVLGYSAVAFFKPDLCIRLFGPEPDVAAEAAKYLKIIALSFPFSMFSQVACAALRATEHVKVPLFSSLSSVIVNTFLNYCLIYGKLGFPKLGVTGAAVATAVGAVVQAIIVLLFLIFSRNPIKSSPKEALTFDKGFMPKYFATVLPVILNESLWGLGTNIYAMVFTRQGTDEYSAYTIFSTIEQLLYVFFRGLCHASAIIVGKAVGCGDHDDAYSKAKRFLIATPLSAVFIGAIMAVIHKPILSLFQIENEATFTLASEILLFYCAFIGIKMIPYTSICGIFRAGGDTRFCCIFDLLTLYLLGVPAVCIAGLVIHVPFVWLPPIMFVSEELPKAVICVVHFVKRKWIKQITDTVN